ncbi:uncharacterized protein LOC108113882 isoform X2 [Drosophila eugracilis]|nr:uncharacterized protein LOC108113882 isoform X2 [Drosophila eugracilis]
MSNYYKNFNLLKSENITTFSYHTLEMSRLMPIVVSARQPELKRHINYWEYSKNHNIVESFGWDARLILGDGSYAQNVNQITTLSLRFVRFQNGLVLEINNVKLNDLIYLLEISLTEIKN